jgi:RNA polymerase sigma factor FliA
MYTAKGKTQNTDQMLKQHSGLVKKMAYQLKAKLPSCVELDDLVQAGMIGLMDAIQRYEDNHGAQFETYASQRVRGAMLDELRGADWLPRGIRKNMRDIEVAVQQLEQKFGRPPTESEIAKHMNFTLDDYYDVLSDCQELNLKEIGAIMSVSESRVCQLHSQAVARLRASMRDKSWTGVA